MSDTFAHRFDLLNRRSLLKGAAAGAAITTLSAGYGGNLVAGQDATDFGEPEATGGTAVIAMTGTGNPRVFIGTSYYGTISFFVSKLLYTPLMMLDRQWNEIGPGIATDWEWNEEGTELTLSLRDDVVFHDGTPLTAADVEFTYKLAVRHDQFLALGDPSIIAGGREYRDRESDELPGVAVIDDYTVKFTLPTPSSVFELKLTNCGIVPMHLIGEEALEGAEPMDALPFFNGASGTEAGLPVGTGPWKAVEYSPDTNLTLERHDEYFLGAPILDRLILRWGMEGPAIIAGLQSGEFDSAYVTAENARSLEGTEFLDLVANHDLANETVLITATEKEYMSIPVRQALLMALDRDLLIETITYGYAQQAPSIMMHPSLFPNDELATYAYDPEGARQMLDEAGWDWDHTIQLGYFSAQGTPTNAISAVMSMWNEIGLQVEFMPLDSAAQVEIGQAEDHVYDVVMTSFAWLAYDPSTSYSSFASDRRPNYSNFSNPEFDEEMGIAMRSASLDEAAPHYQRAQVILQEELPYAPLWMDAEIWAVNSRMHGGILGRGPLNDIQSEKWWKSEE